MADKERGIIHLEAKATEQQVRDRFGLGDLKKKDGDHLYWNQRRLEVIAGLQQFDPQPLWARGAFVYVKADLADLLYEQFNQNRIDVHIGDHKTPKVHILVSTEYRGLVEELLKDQSCVAVMVVKGNLRHRIDKLGIEKHDDYLTVHQNRLRHVAMTQLKWMDMEGMRIVPPTPGASSQRPERPPLFGGAFVYLEPAHVKPVMDVLKKGGLELQSKHVVCSEKYKENVKKVLTFSPDAPGREAFLLRRAGVVESDEHVKLDMVATPGVTGLDIREVHDDWVEVPPPEQGLSAQNLAKASGDTFCRRSGQKRMEPRAVQEAEHAVDEDSRPTVPSVATLLRLSDNLTMLKDLDVYQVEFLTSNPEMQELEEDYMDLWRETWQKVSEENPWIEMVEPGEEEDDEEPSQACPHCTLCDKWIDVKHLLSETCRTRVKNWCGESETQVGPLLQEIMDAGHKHLQEKFLRRNLDDESSDEEEKLLQLMESQNENTPETTKQIVSKVGPGLESTHMCVCGLPAPGRNSDTHCCRRCEVACKAGHRLSADPDTGHPWKKAHGPDCTLHKLRAYSRGVMNSSPQVPPFHCPPPQAGRQHEGQHRGLQHHKHSQQSTDHQRGPPQGPLGQHGYRGPPLQHRRYYDGGPQPSHDYAGYRDDHRHYDRRPSPNYKRWPQYRYDMYDGRPPPQRYERPHSEIHDRYYDNGRRGCWDRQSPSGYGEDRGGMYSTDYVYKRRSRYDDRRQEYDVQSPYGSTRGDYYQSGYWQERCSSAGYYARYG